MAPANAPGAGDPLIEAGLYLAGPPVNAPAGAQVSLLPKMVLCSYYNFLSSGDWPVLHGRRQWLSGRSLHTILPPG